MSDQINNMEVCGCCSQNDTASILFNSAGLSALKYRIGTHGSFKKQMLDAISNSGVLAKLTTRNDNDFAIATLDAWATVLDVLSFYQQRICNEGYLRTAIERLSIVYLAQHINYVPASGVSAETYLAFSMSEAQGAPASAIIPKGTKVQSIPKQNQLPQVFETEKEITANVNWNKITPQSKFSFQPKVGDLFIYINGIQTGLQLGDKILFVSSDPAHDYDSDGDDWDFRSIVNISIDTTNNCSVIGLDAPIGQTSTFPKPPEAINTQIIMKAPDYPSLNWIQKTDHYYNQQITSKLTYKVNSPKAIELQNYNYLSPIIKALHAASIDPQSLKDKNIKVYAMRQKANLFGYNAPDFQSISGNIKSEFLQKGLIGLYFNDISLGTTGPNTLIRSSIDATIDFSISADQSSTSFPIVNRFNFSARWFGLLQSPVTDNITLHTESDDGVRVWINDTKIIDNWTSHPQTSNDVSIALESGKLYSIQLEYFQSDNPQNTAINNPAIIQLFWSSSQLTKEILPADFLFHVDQNFIDWPDLSISAISSHELNTIYLDALYPKIVRNNMLIMANPEQKALFCIRSVADSSQSRFTLTSKTTKLGVSANPDFSYFNNRIRDSFIYSQSEELQMAQIPITAPLNNNQIALEGILTDLFTGQKIFINGKCLRLQLPVSAGEVKFTPLDNSQFTKYFRETSLKISRQPIQVNDKIQYTVIDDGGLQGIIQDDPDSIDLNQWKPKTLAIISAQKDDILLNEFHTIGSIQFLSATDSTHYSTLLTLNEPITTYFDLQTVTINANVASANHGETRQEVLGNGNSSQIFQKFQLKQQPLTFTTADNPRGVQTTLQIQVNNITWKEVSSFYGTSPKDKIYTVTIADDGTVTICFGDGITGSPLPTGSGNVKAIYRTGIGLDGSMDANQLSMLVTPQLGVSKVTNSLASSGAQDAETVDSARKNAPLTVLTLDRIVSANDFENFTRAFANIGKARADVAWNGEQEIINITAALSNGASIQPADKVYDTLLDALKDYGRTNATISLNGFLLTPFTIDVAVAIDEDYEFDIVKQNVATSLFQAFSFDNMDFGQSVTAAQIINIVQQVEGVEYVQLKTLSNQDPFTGNDRIISSIPKLGDDGSFQPAELLIIDINNSTITQLN